MKFLRKTVAALLAMLILLSLCACKKSTKSAKQTPQKITLSDDDGITPALWRVTDKKGNVIYLFGTIHAGDKRSKKVMKKLETTLEECDSVAVEFDIVSYEKDTNAQKRDLIYFLCEDSGDITEHISQELYEKVAAKLTEYKMYNKLYDSYKPALWDQLINQVMIKESGLSVNYAMDRLIINKAYESDKKVLEVESAEFQTKLLADAPDEYYSILFNYEIDNFDAEAASINELYENWIKGDTDTILKMNEDDSDINSLSEQEQKTVEDFNYKMLGERNIGMVEKIKEYMNSGDTVFFAVGTMHFLGDDGILSLLKKEGYKIKRVEYY